MRQDPRDLHAVYKGALTLQFLLPSLVLDSRIQPTSWSIDLILAFVTNTQKRWLFKRVDSAGLRIPTPFTKAIIEASAYVQKLGVKDNKRVASKPAIAAIAGDSSNFQTDDFPKEKETVLKRMHEQTANGLIEARLLEYDYILCFGLTTHRLLNDIIRNVQSGDGGKKVKAEVVNITEGNWYTGAETQDALIKLSSQLKVALKGFAKKKLNWEQPLIGISVGEWRTLQVRVNRTERENLEKDKGDLSALKLWEKKGCRMVIVPDINSHWLVSISGPQKKLVGAQKFVDAKNA